MKTAIYDDGSSFLLLRDALLSKNSSVKHFQPRS